jgi:hypothetical protein
MHQHMQRRLILILIFLTTCLLVGLVYWRNTDWWCYVEIGSRRTPKFKLTPIEQFAESMAVGSLAAAAVAGLAWVMLPRESGRVTDRSDNPPETK